MLINQLIKEIDDLSMHNKSVNFYQLVINEYNYNQLTLIYFELV